MRSLKGWKHDPLDLRDLMYSASNNVANQVESGFLSWVFRFCATVRIPVRELFGRTDYPSIDLRGPRFPTILDQGDLSDCVENATLTMEAFVRNTTNPELLSRLFLYYNVRGGIPVDDGSVTRAGLKSLASTGSCLESLWPYDTTKWADKPDSVALAGAKALKFNYYKLNTISDMLHCLSNGFPFIFGMNIYDPFETLNNKDGEQFEGTPVLPMPDPSTGYCGSHCLIAVGSNIPAQLMLIRNSWGESWGNKGYFWLPFDYICNPLLADSFWTMRVK